MTIRTIKAALLISAITIFSSCTRFKYIHSDSYVMYYYIYDGIKLDTTSLYTNVKDNNGNMRAKRVRPEIDINLRNIHKEVNWESEGEDYELYQQLSIKHNDISYDSKVPISYPPGIVLGVGSAIYPDWVSISVTCDSDFDASHPAGSELNDIMKGEFQSSFLYIKGGYKDESLTLGKIKPLNEITADDLCMLAWRMTIYFTAKPEIQDKKQISVTVMTNEGNIYTDSCVFDFSL